MIERLEIILKLTERCNIACTYCYYFENHDKSALSRPPRLTEFSVATLIAGISEAMSDDFCRSLRIIFHGGEPLLYGKQRFEKLCSRLVSSFPEANISLCMQTNAMLIDDEWIDLFERFDISVGVSVDGPRDIHNKHRVDKRGGPTFDKTLIGIHKLVEASVQNRISPPGALIVINSGCSPSEIFYFVVNDLKIVNMDFLFPDITWDNSLVCTSSKIGDYLCAIYDHWVVHGQDGVTIRVIKSTISLLLGRQSLLGGYGPKRSSALTVLSDGEINGDDFLRPCGDDVVELNLSLDSSTLQSAFSSNNEKLSALGASELPVECRQCAYEKICCGGQLTHRYSAKNGFRNKSVYCSDLKQFYEHVCISLYKSGVEIDVIEHALR